MNELISQIADHLYCLNLQSREDRKTRSQEVFDNHNLDVEFVPAISGETYETTGRMLANYKAQNQGMINIFQDAIDKGFSMIGIFEDDIEFTDDAPQVLNEALNDLPDNWDCFTLGCLNNRYKATLIGGRVYKLRHADLGTCWFFKASMFHPMIDKLSVMDIPYDNCISSVFSDFDNYKAYGILYKGVAYQRVGYSDNLGADVDNSEVT